jgi:hypothetical protein
MFRIPQMRANDVVRLCNGLFNGMDLSKDYGGWTIAQALSFIEAMLGKSDAHRGPIRFQKRTIGGSTMPLAVKAKLLDDVFCHPVTGANQNISHPQDAPVHAIPGRESAGYDFFQRPLIRGPGTQISLVDRSLAGIGCIEALCNLTLSTSDFYYELDYVRRGMKPRVRPGSNNALALHTWLVFRRG